MAAGGPEGRSRRRRGGGHVHSLPEGTPPGRFEFSIETDTVIFNPVEGTTYTTYGPIPRATWTVDRFYPEFQPCVEATSVDVYGRRSDTTELCRPDGCEVRDKNDRRAIDWDAVDGCSDWSPGYIERNAPGCACAQAPGRPAGEPVGLALLALGALFTRRAHRVGSNWLTRYEYE